MLIDPLLYKTAHSPNKQIFRRSKADEIYLHKDYLSTLTSVKLFSPPSLCVCVCVCLKQNCEYVA
jgi:hypothetical protein